MNVKIGLCIPNPGWKIVLSQEGLYFETIEKDSEFNLEEFVLVIPNREMVESNRDIFIHYITNSGLVIADKETFPILLDIEVHKRNISYVIPTVGSLFSQFGLIDFYTEFGIPKTKSSQILDEDLHIYEYSNKLGNVVILPFSINDLILNKNSVRKRFYAERKELPSEVVSRVSKGKISEIIFRIILQNFSKLKAPLVHKWYYPKGSENVFIFRIDTDFCSAEDAKNLYALCEKYNINATWFVDTQDENMLSEVYTSFSQHEIALHCENHKVYKSYKENYDNILCAQKKLKKYGIDAKGFAAPFGEWNEALGQVIEDLEFHYSSEFALDYDDVPFYPFYNNHFSTVLQIPIHPISIGRLRRSHFSDEEMLEYYKNVIDYNFSHNIPAVIYHHPHHKKLDIIEEIFSYIKTKNVWNPTMYEFSLWWKKRMGNRFSYTFMKDSITVTSDDQDMCYTIITEDGNTAAIQPNRENKLDGLSYTKAKPIQFNEKRLMRQFYWRDVLQNYEQKKAKKLQ